MDSLICNFPKCRKELEAFAWVTSCSHIFCDDDGSRQFSKAFKCPACDTIVSGRFDIIRVDLKPSEQYKSMVLAGLKPETVMEICTRSLSFWTYQTQQEKSYQEYVSNKAKERAVQLEQYYEQIVTRTHAELNSLKSQIGAAKKELEVAKKKYNEVTEKLQEKSRQNQKLQSLYDALRRRCITPCLGNRDQSSDNSKHLPANYNIPLPLTTVEVPCRGSIVDIASGLSDHSKGLQNDLSAGRHGNNSPPERDFVFRPNSTPVINRTSSVADIQSLHNRFNIDLHLAER